MVGARAAILDHEKETMYLDHKLKIMYWRITKQSEFVSLHECPGLLTQSVTQQIIIILTLFRQQSPNAKEYKVVLLWIGWPDKVISESLKRQPWGEKKIWIKNIVGKEEQVQRP